MKLKMEGFKIKVEFDSTLKDQTLEGKLIDTVILNRMGRNGKNLIYQMNIRSEHNIVYMWFKDESDINYFIELNI